MLPTHPATGHALARDGVEKGGLPSYRMDLRLSRTGSLTGTIHGLSPAASGRTGLKRQLPTGSHRMCDGIRTASELRFFYLPTVFHEFYTGLSTGYTQIISKI